MQAKNKLVKRKLHIRRSIIFSTFSENLEDYSVVSYSTAYKYNVLVCCGYSGQVWTFE